MKILLIILIVGVVLVNVNCSGKLSGADYTEFVSDPENHIRQTLKVGATNLTVEYVPAELVTNRIEATMTEGELQNNSDLVFFKVRFDVDKSQIIDYAKTLYLDFEMKQDFTLKVGQHTLLPSFIQKIEKGVHGCYEYIVCFDQGKATPEVLSLSYTDKIFGVGVLSFQFQSNDIIKIPSLKSSTTDEHI